MTPNSGESPRSAAQDAWSRLPGELRRRVIGKRDSDTVTVRVYRHLLRPAAVEADPTLRPVMRDSGGGALSPEQAEAARTAILAMSDRLAVAAEWVAELRAGHARAGSRVPASVRRGRSFAEQQHWIFPYAWRRSADPGERPEPDACEALMDQLLHADPHRPPPSHSALRMLFLNEDEVARLEAAIGRRWRGAQEIVPLPADRHASEGLLDAPTGAEWAKLWGAYLATRPWEPHLRRVDELGLSRQATAPRPRALEPGRWADGATDDPATGPRDPVLPLDRSIRQRLDWPLRLLQRREEIQGLTTVKLADDEVRRATAPLGILDDELRALLCLAALAAEALSPDLARQARIPSPRTPRHVQQLAKVAWTRPFVKQTLRLGDGQHAPVRQALDAPTAGFCRALWGGLHRHELARLAPGPPEERWDRLVMPAARTFLGGLAEEIRSVLEGTTERLGPTYCSEADPDALAGGLPAAGQDPGTIQGLVLDVITDHLTEQHLSGDAAVAFLDRFTDQHEEAWAVATWTGLWAGYREHPGGPSAAGGSALPHIDCAQAQEVVRRFRDTNGSGETR